MYDETVFDDTIAAFAHLFFSSRHIFAALIRIKLNIIFIMQVISMLMLN